MTKIYYFSGTGNSLWSARKIAQLIGGECELKNIGVEARNTNPVIEAQAVVFVFPSYAFGLPLVVSRFIKSAVFKSGYAASFVTFGSTPGGTLGQIRRLLKKKGIPKLYFGKIPSVENYLAIFGPPKESTLIRRIAMQEKATEIAGQAVQSRAENKACTFTPFSSFVLFLFSLGVKIFYKMYKVASSCNGCGICCKICPVNAVIMKDGKPVFTKGCEHCQSCVNICPQRSIGFARVKPGSPGYIRPEIEIKDLIAGSSCPV